jgi:hypothetical protein
MGLFSSKGSDGAKSDGKPGNTVSNEQAASLAWRANKADNTDWSNPTAADIARADRDDRQHGKRHLS